MIQSPSRLSSIQVLGIAVLGVGIYVRVQPGQIDQFVGNAAVPVISWILIGVGGFLFTIGFAGCAGAYFKNKTLIYIVSADNSL